MAANKIIDPMLYSFSSCDHVYAFIRTPQVSVSETWAQYKTSTYILTGDALYFYDIGKKALQAIVTQEKTGDTVWGLFLSEMGFFQNSDYLTAIQLKKIEALTGHTPHLPYNHIFFDECQNGTLFIFKQLSQLTVSQDVRSLTLCGDSNQRAKNALSEQPLVIEWYKKFYAQRSFKPYTLQKIYRFSKEFEPFIRMILNAKLSIAGKADKNALIEVSCNSSSEIESAMLWFGTKQAVDDYDCETTCVITLPEFLEEAQKKFPHLTVYLSDEVQGREFDAVIYWRIWDDKVFEEAAKEEGFSINLSCRNVNRTKNMDNKQNYSSAFNAQFVNFSRAKKRQIVYQDLDSKQYPNRDKKILIPAKKLFKIPQEESIIHSSLSSRTQTHSNAVHQPEKKTELYLKGEALIQFLRKQIEIEKSLDNERVVEDMENKLNRELKIQQKRQKKKDKKEKKKQEKMERENNNARFSVPLEEIKDPSDQNTKIKPLGIVRKLKEEQKEEKKVVQFENEELKKENLLEKQKTFKNIFNLIINNPEFFYSELSKLGDVFNTIKSIDFFDIKSQHDCFETHSLFNEIVHLSKIKDAEFITKIIFWILDFTDLKSLTTENNILFDKKFGPLIHSEKLIPIFHFLVNSSTHHRIILRNFLEKKNELCSGFYRELLWYAAIPGRSIPHQPFKYLMDVLLFTAHGQKILILLAQHDPEFLLKINKDDFYYCYNGVSLFLLYIAHHTLLLDKLYIQRMDFITGLKSDLFVSHAILENKSIFNVLIDGDELAHAFLYECFLINQYHIIFNESLKKNSEFFLKANKLMNTVSGKKIIFILQMFKILNSDFFIYENKNTPEYWTLKYIDVKIKGDDKGSSLSTQLNREQLNLFIEKIIHCKEADDIVPFLDPFDAYASFKFLAFRSRISEFKYKNKNFLLHVLDHPNFYEYLKNKYEDEFFYSACQLIAQNIAKCLSPESFFKRSNPCKQSLFDSFILMDYKSAPWLDEIFNANQTLIEGMTREDLIQMPFNQSNLWRMITEPNCHALLKKIIAQKNLCMNMHASDFFMPFFIAPNKKEFTNLLTYLITSADEKLEILKQFIDNGNFLKDAQEFSSGFLNSKFKQAPFDVLYCLATKENGPYILDKIIESNKEFIKKIDLLNFYYGDNKKGDSIFSILISKDLNLVDKILKEGLSIFYFFSIRSIVNVSERGNISIKACFAILMNSEKGCDILLRLFNKNKKFREEVGRYRYHKGIFKSVQSILSKTEHGKKLMQQINASLPPYNNRFHRFFESSGNQQDKDQNQSYECTLF